MNKNKIDNLLKEAIENIRHDRKSAQAFLNEIANQIFNDAELNRSLSPVAAKHVETMQRSNEQLVKIITLQQKSQGTSVELSDDDKNQLFDMIPGSGEKEGVK